MEVFISYANLIVTYGKFITSIMNSTIGPTHAKAREISHLWMTGSTIVVLIYRHVKNIIVLNIALYIQEELLEPVLSESYLVSFFK